MTISLDSALSGLRAAQQQLDVISGNISNASTPGYSRKILPQETQAVGGQTIGVLSDPITRQVDMNIQKDLWTQVSATSFFDVQAGYMSQIQAFNGPPDKGLTIAATIAGLQNDFIQLSNAPDNQTQIGQTVIQAQSVAKKFNNYSDLVNQMRNDTQTQITDSVTQANNLLNQIASANQKIKFATSTNSTTAAYADQRDQAIKSLSELIGITTFTRGDGVLVVQTTQGQQLTDETASPLFFKSSPVSAQSAYPGTAAGLYLGGDPALIQTAADITTIGVGGKIGAYLQMRDTTLPQYQAQLDEMAQKLASRFDAQGVRLFTDSSGAVPADANPIPNPPGPLTPVPYVGFAGQITVNPAVARNNSLIQSSTLQNVVVQKGSPEFLNRIVDYAFGANEYQQAQGSVDVRVSGGVAPANTLQNVFGLNPDAQLLGTVDIKTLSLGVPLNQATGNPFTPPSGPITDTFTLRFDAGGGNDTGNININLTAVNTAFPAPPAASGAAALVSYLNANTIPALGAPLNTQISASLNQFGQLMINSQVAIDVGAGNMGTNGLNFLGLTAGSTAAQSPYFDIQVGQDNYARVSVAPGDDETTLLTKLNNIPGVQASIDIVTGKLSMRPGPGFGGSLKVIAGPILSTGGNTIIKELFGSDTPVVNVANSAFRTANLGPLANISSGVTASGSSITDYAQKVISAQSQDATNITSKQADETSYRDLISKRFTDASGVNLDEELSQLIVVQTAYSASAKTITTLNDMFKQLLNAI